MRENEYKKTNVEVLNQRFRDAGFSDDAYVSIMQSIANGRDEDIMDSIDAMDRQEFDRFFKEVVVPRSANLIRSMSMKYPNESENLARLQVNLARSAGEWDRDRFKQVLGRKDRKDTVDGVERVSKATIGNLSDQDILTLRNAGIDEAEALRMAERFNAEDRAIRAEEMRKKYDQELMENRRQQASEYPYNIFELESPHNEHWLSNWLKAGVNSIGGSIMEMVAPEVVETNRQAIREGRDPRWSDIFGASGKDLGFNLAALYTPVAAGGAVTRLMPKAGRVAQGMASSVLGGAGIAAETLARQAASDYYDIDPETAGKAGLIAGTIPAFVSMATSKISSIPGAQRFMRPVMRRVRGLGAGPIEIESEQAAEKFDELMDAYRKATEKGLTRKQRVMFVDAMRRKAEEAAAFINSSWRRAGYGNNVTADDVIKMLKSRARNNPAKKFYEAPTQQEIENAVWKKARYEGVDSDDAAEALERMETQWPNTYNEVMYPTDVNPMQKAFSTAINAANDVGGVVEPVSEFRNSKKAPSAKLKKLMNEDPNLIQQWKLGFRPHKGVNDSLYEEWVEKYGNRYRQ